MNAVNSGQHVLESELDAKIKMQLDKHVNFELQRQHAMKPLGGKFSIFEKCSKLTNIK